MCKNRIKYRTNVAISPKNLKDVGCLDWKICGLKLMLVHSRLFKYAINVVLS